MQIREAKESDVNEITNLFYNTIQHVNIRDYSQDQVNDWASWHEKTDRWITKIREQYFIVALSDNIIAGFASLATDGYLDFMFVHKDYQRQGVATLLLHEIEKKAIEQGNTSIYSEVSITARSFFESNGYGVEKEQLKKARNEYMTNFIMKKHLR